MTHLKHQNPLSRYNREPPFLSAIPRLRLKPDRSRNPNDAFLRAPGDFPEPIGPIARIYTRDLVIADIAAELGLADSVALAADLRRLGGENGLDFAALAQGGAITRDQWRDEFDRVIVALKLGTIKKLYGGKPD